VRRVELWVALAILCLAGAVLDSWTAQPASRYLLTVAVVDHHRLDLDDNADLLDVDQAFHDGHHYSDKAPYQPMLAAPAYLAYRAVGGDAFPSTPDGDLNHGGFHWGRWWVDLWSATVPAIVLCLLLRKLIAQERPGVATPAALGLSLGTMLLPFASALFGHVMVAMFLAGAWVLARPPSPSARAMVGTGLLLGAAVGTEFPAVIPGIVIVLAVLLANGPRPTAWLAVGGVVGTLPLLAYNWVAFDNPLKTAYQGNLPNFQGSGAFGVYNLVAPQLDELRKSMIGDRGLLTLTPICALAVGGAVLAIVQRTSTRRDAFMGLVILGSLWLMSAGIDGYGGSSPGPRYLIPALPFLAVPLSEAWHRWPRLCAATAVFGFVPLLAATMTAPLVGTDYTQSARYWLERLLRGDVSRSVPGELLGNWALYAVVAVGVACAVRALVIDRAARWT
jgi:hypothetical protein